MKKYVYIVIAILSLVNCQVPTMPEKVDITVRYEVQEKETEQENYTPTVAESPQTETTAPDRYRVDILYHGIVVESYTARDEAEWQSFKRMMPLHLENLGPGYSASWGSS